MNCPSTRKLLICTVLGLVTCGLVPAHSQRLTPLDPQTLDSITRHLDGTPRSLAARGITGCVVRQIDCGQTRTAVIDNSDCATSDQSTFFDGWVFDGHDGDLVILDMTSTQLDPFLLLLDPDGELFADDDDSGPGLNARIVTTLDQTGQWLFSASGLPGLAETGAYTLNLDCQQVTQPPPAPPCDPDDPLTLCLDNDRFQVQVDWRTNQGTSGQGNAVQLTPDTGYFWFFQEENVELVIKVLNACSFADRFWVFAGGLTNVEVDITVTDTRENVTSFYRNPIDTPFQPIQDTNAFATCP